MNLGIMFFASSEQTTHADRYWLLKRIAQFADQHGFCCIWTPERHFHDFGGLFPNPSVLSAAIAMITHKLQIRAGSLVSPLHHAIRIAEEWSLVDNLSGGRVAISFGSGWNVDDFIFFPDHYANRQLLMYEQIGTIQDLWSGKEIQQLNPLEKKISVQLFPKPVQSILPVWITSSGNIETFISAGRLGANVLTHMMGQDIAMLAEKIAAYRKARGESGYNPESGIVSLMLHTYVGSNADKVQSEARGPFRNYLRSAISLENKSAKGGGVISGGREIKPEEISSGDMEELLDITVDRYFKTAALVGTPRSCLELIRKFEEIGVTEVACLIDFGVDSELVMKGMYHLNDLREMCSASGLSDAMEQSISEFTADLE